MIRIGKKTLIGVIVVLIGVTINVLFSFLTYSLKLPLYLDTIGTIGVAALCGTFPGFTTAILTNIFCAIFNQYAIYYSGLNILIAALTAYFVRNDLLKKKFLLPLFTVVIAIVGGGLGSIIQLVILGIPQFDPIREAAQSAAAHSRFGFVFYVVIFNICLNIVDKGICAVSVLTIIRILNTINSGISEYLKNLGWKQRPLSAKEIKAASKNKFMGGIIQQRFIITLSVLAVIVTTVMAAIGVNLNFQSAKDEYRNNAIGASKILAKTIGNEDLEKYFNMDKGTPAYFRLQDQMEEIKNDITGIKYLYLFAPERNGMRFLADLDLNDEAGYYPNELIEYDKSMKPIVDKLLRGDKVEPFIEKKKDGWLITSVVPVKDSKGDTVFYVGADAYVYYVSDYVKLYCFKVFLILFGFLLWVISFALWISRYYLVHPINSMAICAEQFIYNSDNTAILADNVNRLSELDIETNDELQTLYDAMKKMTENAVSQMNDVKMQSKMISQMQTGLIITMADLVENRDADTGFHIQKTADYVRIIVEGLQKKGYYQNKMTPKYIADVEMSAPLHDIGKINIPDAILNKPGKLTDEEFEIMKSHTTAGRKIMEKAILTVRGDNYLREARNMAGYHHEKWDGSGYPEGLKGEVIPLSARIMAVADVFDALTSKRIYKEGMPLERAMKIIEEGSGTHFDPKIVEVFLEAKDEVRNVLRRYSE